MVWLGDWRAWLVGPLQWLQAGPQLCDIEGVLKRHQVHFPKRSQKLEVGVIVDGRPCPEKL